MKINRSSKKYSNYMLRDYSLDFAKGIGMLLVMFGHTNYQQPLLTIIYSFHMPLFFVISGILYNDSKYQTFGYFFVRKI